MLSFVRRLLPSPARLILRRAKNWFSRLSMRVGSPQNLGNNVVGQLVRLPDFCIYVDPADIHIGRAIRERFSYEPQVEQLLRRLLKPGDVVLDVGANVGFHSLIAATAVGPTGRVFSIEMSAVNCTLLRASIQANSAANITLFETAVAESRQTLSYCLGSQTGNGMIVNDHIQQVMREEPRRFTRAVEVSCQPVDDLIPSNVSVDLVKIDIEGFELRAFRGMQRILRDSRPMIILEFFPHLLNAIGETQPIELLDFLRGYGYRFSTVDGKYGLGQDLDNQILLSLAGGGLIDLLATRPTAE